MYPICPPLGSGTVYSPIRQSFPFSRVTTNKSVLCNVAIIRVLPFINNPKDLDLSYRMDQDF